ncbi:MAG: hypothetical protein JWR07_3809, partial [Nevskia sp.]|nr:hypothetical protein [Nevskia sp.]
MIRHPHWPWLLAAGLALAACGGSATPSVDASAT